MVQIEGLEGKLFLIIKSLYKNVRACVKHKGHIKNLWWSSTRRNVVPIIIILNVSDNVEKYFININCTSIELQIIKMF